MPNHVRNVLKFSKLDAKDKDFILRNFTSVLEDTDGVFPLNLIFDFDKIVPEPKLKSECPDVFLVNKDSHVSPYEDRPWFNWYDWHNEFWGTKWNAYDGYVIVGKSTVTFVFSTAWNTPIPIYGQLATAYPNLKWEVRYADEDLGNNCGILSHDVDDTSISEQDPSDMANPTAFARRLWENY